MKRQFVSQGVDGRVDAVTAHDDVVALAIARTVYEPGWPPPGLTPDLVHCKSQLALDRGGHLLDGRYRHMTLPATSQVGWAEGNCRH